MGNKKRLALSIKRKSRRRLMAKIRRAKQQKKLLLNKASTENAENITNIQLPVKSISNINLEVETGILHCLSQVIEKEVNNKGPVKMYEEENIFNGNIKYCKDKDNLIIDNQNLDNEEQIETYEEQLEVYEEQIEAYEEQREKESTYNENSENNKSIEYCKDKEDFIMGNNCLSNRINNISKNICEEEEKEEEESTYNENIENNENIEHCEDEDLVIDNNSVSDRINNLPKNVPEGRYIVDISYMWNEIHRTFDDHARGIECQFKYWQLVNFRRRGLLTQLFFKCQMCNYQTSIWTDPMHSENINSNINAAAATGCVEVGIGYTQMKKLCTAMNIKYMAEATYMKNRDRDLVHEKKVPENIEIESS